MNLIKFLRYPARPARPFLFAALAMLVSTSAYAGDPCVNCPTCNGVPYDPDETECGKVASVSADSDSVHWSSTVTFTATTDTAFASGYPTWTIDEGNGSLDSTTGTSVTYTPKDENDVGNVKLTAKGQDGDTGKSNSVVVYRVLKVEYPETMCQGESENAVVTTSPAGHEDDAPAASDPTVSPDDLGTVDRNGGFTASDSAIGDATISFSDGDFD